MRNFAIAIIAIVVGCCLSASATEEERTCVPGSQFMDDEQCNWCFCGNDGKTVSCTKKQCIKITKRDVAAVQEEEEKQKCVPGSRFMDEDNCNWCHCSEDGKHAACTLMACIKSPVVREKRAAEDKQVCEPGSRYLDADGCNWCRCNAAGTAGACTRRFCHTRKERAADTQVCEPGSRYLDADGCNWCTCNAEGTMGACTRRFCPKQTYKQQVFRTRRDTKKCEPGVNFQHEDGCNWCTCNANGTPGGCTEMMCLSAINIKSEHTRKVREVDEEQRCEPGSRFMDADGCNSCVCSSDGKGAACTRKLCLPKPTPDRVARRAGNYCTPRSSFKQDCNTCLCSDDGKTAACTFRLCISDSDRVRRDTEVAQAEEPEKQICVPNTTFRDAEDCNNCFCNEKGTAAACTLKYCFKLERPVRSVEPVCKPGSTFMDDCNECKCNHDGTAADCTEIDCHAELPQIFKLRSVRSTEQVCEPGSTFKQDCNTCYCSNDGKGAACTQIGCGRVVVAESPRSVRSADQVCEPYKVTRAQDSCNTCQCNAEGTALSCTEVACPALGGVEPKVCTPNSVFKDDCNTCKCHSDGSKAFCTRRLCPKTKRNTAENEDKEVAAQPTPCTPDEVKIEVKEE